MHYSGIFNRSECVTLCLSLDFMNFLSLSLSLSLILFLTFLSLGAQYLLSLSLPKYSHSNFLPRCPLLYSFTETLPQYSLRGTLPLLTNFTLKCCRNASVSFFCFIQFSSCVALTYRSQMFSLLTFYSFFAS